MARGPSGRPAAAPVPRADARTRCSPGATSDNLWKRRTSIICQNTFKAETDLALLYACIEPSLASREFFLRKAIGWALRQYAWTDPDEVVRYVAAHEHELSGLSKREALKNVGRSGQGGSANDGAAVSED